jgi:hypothetical protein
MMKTGFKTEVENKVLIQKLSEYFLTQNPETVCRALAGAMVDMVRIEHWSQITEEERESFFFRVKSNAQMVQDFVMNGYGKDDELVINNLSINKSSKINH